MKKQERLANKKRKLVALAKIVEINESDKAMKNELTRDVDSKTSENMVNKLKNSAHDLDLINFYLFSARRASTKKAKIKTVF